MQAKSTIREIVKFDPKADASYSRPKGNNHMNKIIAKIPEHLRVYEQIREMILFGTLVPGQPVTIQGLIDEVGAGMTPVREALRRLTSEGALTALGNRRISVPVLEPAQLEEIAFVRLSIEPRLAFLAAKKADNGLIDRLQVTDSLLNEAISKGDIEGYLLHNYTFHFQLYDHAEAQVLNAIAGSLWLRIGPSMRVVCGRVGTHNLPDQHDKIIEGLRAKDPEHVRQAMVGDLRQGLDQVELDLGAPPAPQRD